MLLFFLRANNKTSNEYKHILYIREECCVTFRWKQSVIQINNFIHTIGWQIITKLETLYSFYCTLFMIVERNQSQFGLTVIRQYLLWNICRRFESRSESSALYIISIVLTTMNQPFETSVFWFREVLNTKQWQM